MLKNMSFMLFLFLGLIISCQSTPIQNRQTANVIPAAEKKGRHFIITVHGFREEETRFGQIEKVLISHLQELRPGIDYKFLQFRYPTGTDTNVFDFAFNHLSHFLNENIKNPTANDSIVFIAHSQGGLVVDVWKAGAQFGLIPDQKFEHILKDKFYTQITDQVITLGTPFWGSNQAKLALNLNLLKSGNGQELKGMVFNSDLILWVRYLAVEISKQTAFDPTRYTNISGIVSNHRNKLFYQKDVMHGGKDQMIANVAFALFRGVVKRHSFSSEKINSREPDRFESDLTVIVPSGRASFYNAEKKLTCENDTVQAEEFTSVSLFKPSHYILTEGVHSTIVSQRTRGISDVPAFCLDPAKCVHPTYRYVLNLIADCERLNCRPEAKARILDKMFEVNQIDTEYNKILTSGIDLQGFSLDLNLQVPADYELPEKYFRDLSYVETETEEFDSEGNAITVTRRKAVPLSDRKIENKKLVREIIQLDGSKMSEDLLQMTDIRIIRRREGMSGLACWGKADLCSNARELRLHITGWIKPKSLDMVKKYQESLIEKYRDGLVLPFTIQLPASSKYSFKKATLFGRIRPGYSTFAKLDLSETNNCAQNSPVKD